ncbi:MAG: NAD(P)/FAD-dependent oxidoreductase [Candidatus Binatia bacterium]|nr:NAD(P)/FAD-dependent oxidoreductase [Candidatus Binatia bacterium]
MTDTLRPSGEPFEDDDETIAEALESANIPALLMSLVHLTGRTDVLRGPIRPPKVVGRIGKGLAKEEKAAVRAQVLRALADYRDRGCTLPPPPTAETIREMMSFATGEPVPESYVPMMQEEMALDGRDARDVSWDDVPADTRANLRVLVIGAGMSGLLAAIRLQEYGVPYEIVEKNDGVGGTWLENSYPGCRVDVANHFYCYSFEPNPDWSEYFSKRPELREYFETCAIKYGVRPQIRFRTEVVSARWDEGSASWDVVTRSADGTESSDRYDAIISGVGQLNRPRVPDIAGRDSFRGPAFHSARWDHDVDLRGKRVAVVGTGASALQLVPEVAKEAEHLYVMQRSAAWMSPNPAYHRTVPAGKKWLLRHVPYYARWYRFLLFWPASDGLMPSLIVDPDWPHQERSVNELNEQTRIGFTEYVKFQVGEDAALLEKVVPKYPPFVKRMLQDNGSWLSTLQQDDVDLVTDRIAKITPTGLELESGTEIEVDVIVFATGFHANKFLWPMEITGKKGSTLRERWGEEPSAYLGITVPSFPNLFCLYGPGTNLAHAGSIIFHSECQVRYIMGCLSALLKGGHRTIECREDVAAAYEQRHLGATQRTVWAHTGTRSWYKNEAGRVTTVSPWLLVDYWGWTREPDLDDFELR